MSSISIDAAKQAVRERVWNLLETEHAVEPGVHGHIPDFVGTAAAAERLAAHRAWQDAQTVKAVPDTSPATRPSPRPRRRQDRLHGRAEAR